MAPVYKARTPREIPPEAEAALKEEAGGCPHLHQLRHGAQLRQALGQRAVSKLAAKAVVASIGPITSATLKEYGISPQIEPADYTIPALAQAIIDYFVRINPIS